MKTPKRKLSDLLANRPYIVERDGVVTICPVHSDGNEAHPSLRITINDKGCLGFKCRSNGCAFKDIIDGLGVKDVCGFEYGDISTNMVNEASEPVTAEHIEALRSHIAEINPDQKVLDYVKRRWGLSYDDVAQLNIGKDSVWKYAGADNRAHRIFVPFYGFDGVPRGGQARATGDRNPRWSSLKNPEGHAWERLAVFSREDGIEDYVIITEGPGDGLTAYGAGYSAIAIRGATLTGNDHLARQLQAGTRGKRVIIAGDNDKAGQAFAQGVLSILPDALLLSLPKGVKDLSAWFESAPEAFGEALMGAIRNARGGEETASDEDEEEVPKSETEAAEYIIDKYNGDLTFVEGVGLFVWNGVHWEQAWPNESVVRREVLSGIMRDEGWRKFASQRSIENVTKSIGQSARVYRRAEEMDAKPELINVANGTFDVKRNLLLPHNREDLITYVIPHDYNPDAEAPRWDQFLDEVFPELPGVPEYIQRMYGYGITGYNTEQCFLILWGEGKNGKSVLVDVMAELFAPVTETASFESFTTKRAGRVRDDLAELRGARLVMSTEGNQTDQMDEALIKTVTGSDKITTRFLYGRQFTFEPTFLITLATNHPPAFKGQDKGVWRRVRFVPFNRTFSEEERDKGLKRYLIEEEAEGILRWAIEGAVDWFERSSLDEPESIIQATEDYKEENNPTDGFLPGWYEITDDLDEAVSADHLWQAYRIYAKHKGYQTFHSDRTFNRHVKSFVPEWAKYGPKRTYHARGVRFVGAPELGEYRTTEDLLNAHDRTDL